ADAPDRFAHGAGATEKKEAERDDFRPGVTGGAGAGPQSIEATTAALGDMEPSAGSEGRGAGAGAESANDDDTRPDPRGDAASGPGNKR
ncbi:MAG TPA: hypothetical protein VE642_02740, partial [Pyrinomonadaceae bacterium]|nr:hypothetical protein [Pyrinomonadaceae bacterium]